MTPAVLLGDRVRVNGLRLDGGTLIVDVLDHAAGQPLSSAPDVAVTKRFAVSAGALIAK